MVLREEYDIQSKNTLILIIYVCPWTVTILNYLLLQLRVQIFFLGPFSMTPFPRIVSAELNPLMI